MSGDAIDLLGRLRRSGVEVWAEGSSLRYRARTGALSDDLRGELAVAKDALLAVLADPRSELPTLRRTAPDGPAPLSAGQQRLWFLDQAQPANPVLNLPYALRLRGRLDVPALRSALNGLIERHAALRTVYPTVDGEPAAVELDRIELDLPVVPVDPAELRCHIDQEFRAGFDLSRGPLVRARLLAESPEQHVLLVSFHHIAFDGWSWSIFLRELGALYGGAVAGTPAALAEQVISYADYAHWQQSCTRTETFAHQLAYWRESLRGAPQSLELPADRPRPARPSLRGDAVFFELPGELAERLEALARSESATLFIVLMAAYEAALARWTGRTDFLVGTPVAGRRDAGLDQLVGFLVNLLVLRADVSGRPTFRELVRRTREVALAAYANQDVPFERVVDEVGGPRDLSRSPLFQTMLTLQNAPATRPRLAGVVVEPVRGATGIAKHDLSLIFESRGGLLRGVLEFSTDLFDRLAAERLTRQLTALLWAVVADPDQRVDDLTLDDAAALEARRRFDDTAQALPENGVVTELLAAQAAATPDAIALEFGSERLTYATLERRANQVAWRLRRLGVGPDVAVGLLVDRSVEMVVGILAILKAGGAYVPLDPEYPAARLALMLEDTQARVLVTLARLDEQDLGFEGPVVRLDADAAVIASEREDVPDTGVVLANVAYVIYTSGSTGRPKGVHVPHQALLNIVVNRHALPDLTSDDRLLAVVSHLFDPAVVELLVPLTVGATIVLAPRDVARDGIALVGLLRSARVTALLGTTSTGRLLIEAGWPGDERLKLSLGGEALGAELAAALLERCGELWNVYGPTEATVFGTGERVRDPHDVTIGRPVANTRILLLDGRQQPVPDGAVGEICIAGLGVARGYGGRPALTAERFLPDPSGVDGARLYRTGDLARLRADGRLQFLGRLDHQVKLRGHRIEVGEVETALETHPAIRQAVVTLRSDRSGDPQLAAFVVPDGGDAPAAVELREHLRESLPAYMVPAAIVALEQLPAMANGKVDRNALPDVTPEPERSPSRPPATDRERLVAAVFADVIGIAAAGVGVDDEFFELGGDSMKAVRAVRRIDSGLAVMDLFAHPTVGGLAAYLDDAAQPARRALLHRLSAPRTAPAEVTLVCVPFGGGGPISYRELAGHVPPSWEVHGVELPGHELARADEPLASVDDVAERCAVEILATAPAELVVYGHCVGSALAVAIAREVEQRGGCVRGVVVGANFPGAGLPGLAGRLVRLWPGSRPSDRMLEDSLRALGGLSETLAEDERRLLARTVRHDGDQVDAFYARAFADPDGHRIDAPILCVVGGADRMSDFADEQVAEWELFSADVELSVIPGAQHFFNRQQAPELGAILHRRVETWRAPAPPRAAPRRTRSMTARLRDFLLVAFGQFVSMIGSGLTTFALGVWAYQATGRLSTFAAVQTVALVPAIAAAPIAGAVADRFDRRRVMLACDAVGAVTAATAAALSLTHILQVWHVFVVAAIAATAATFRQPAYLAGATQLVPKRYLGNANGLLGLGGASGFVLSQVLGGAIMAAVGLGGALALDVCSYAVAFATLVAVRFPDLAFRRRREPLLREIVSGWAYLLARRPLLGLTAFFTVANVLGGMAFVLATPLLLQTTSTPTLGLVLGAQGAGLVAGSAVMTVWGGTRRRALGLIAPVTVFGAATFAIAIHPGVVGGVLGMFAIGVMAAVITAHWLSLVQVKVPTDMQGRVLATCQMLARLATPVGLLVVGPLVSDVLAPLVRPSGPLHGLGTLLGPVPAARPLSLAMLLTGGAALALTAAALGCKPLRDAGELLPDAASDRRSAAC